MSLQERDKPRIAGLSTRPITRYMALLAAEIEAGRFTLPEASTQPEEQVEIPGAPGTPAWDRPTEPDPWVDEPVTVGVASTRRKATQENAAWARPEATEEAVQWEAPEGERVGAQDQEDREQDDFARAMAYLSADDDFLVTGVGKSQAQEPGATEKKVISSLPTVPKAATLQVAEEEDYEEEPPRPLLPRSVMLIGLGVLALVTIGIAVWYFFLRDVGDPITPAQASAVFVGDVSIGCVLDGEALNLKVESARQAVEDRSRLPAVLGQDVRIEPVVVDARFLASQEEMEAAVLNASEILVEAAGVYVDGHFVAATYSQAMVDWVLEEALEPYQALAEQNRAVSDLRFAEEIEVRPLRARPEDIMDEKGLRALLVEGESPREASYEVVSGDSLIAIARGHDMTLGELRYANPDLIGKDLIQVGMELSIEPPRGLLTVQFTERVELTIDLPYETITKTSDALYTTERKVEVKGEVGRRDVVADRVYIAGVMVEEEILSEKIVKEPVDEVVVKGTKKVTNQSGSSTYLWPISGRISSNFGARWERQHQGLDIAASTGTPIYASRSGTVTFSGTNGGYGKMVEIDHGGGVRTRYAHCSSLKVSSGDKVKQGQLIALAGSTGNSTGPHLHFEVRVSGTAKNPLNYLPEK